MATSLNGYQAPPAKLRTFPIPGANRRITLDEEVGPILVALAADYHASVRNIDKGTWDEGGYNYRDANGATGKLSNHASGTAVDLNWSEEGAQGGSWGARFFSQAEVYAKIQVLKARYGAVLQWGGDWRAKDYMHWEIKPGVTRAQVLAHMKKLGIDSNGVRKEPVVPLPTKEWDGKIPEYEKVIKAEAEGIANTASWRLACRLYDLGHYEGKPQARGVQGYPAKAVAAWQKSKKYKATGKYGPIAHNQIFGS